MSMFYELWILLLMFLPQLPCKLPPHIVIIVIDDLGENKKHIRRMRSVKISITLIFQAGMMFLGTILTLWQ